jgi:pimeloyl-ACP methyl ester carboxylesterase
MRSRYILSVLLAFLIPAGVVSQTRSLTQDPTLNNLQHPPGVKTGALETLGRVRKLGTGRRTLLLIPGLGFSGDIWTEFMERHRADYTMLAITLPGFGDTPPLPMPPEGSRFAETPWTRSAISAIEKLLDQEHVERATIVAHWALATQIAFRLALAHPDRVEAVVLVGGALKVYYEGTPMMNWTAAQRAQYVEGMASHWFKTVTRRTWDDNNFMSYDYATNPRRGLFLWREAQTPTLAVWIRYLLEFYSFDLTPELKKLRVPILVVQPSFDDPAFYVEKDRNYMRNLCLDSWQGTGDANEWLTFVRIPQSRLFIMYDQPDELDRVIEHFLGATGPARTSTSN